MTIEQILFGKKEKKITMRQQMSRIIVLCCIIAVLVQAVVMISLIIRFYIRREVRDTEYVLQSANESMNKTIQFLEERMLAIRHDARIMEFFSDESYSADTAKEYLSNTADLFSERNRAGYQTPFVTELYLFNREMECLFDRYYPSTVKENGIRKAEMIERAQRFLRQSKPFYYEPSGEDITLSMHMYDTNMKQVGCCVVVLSTRHVQEVYGTLDKSDNYSWTIMTEDGPILSKNDDIPVQTDGPAQKATDRVLEDIRQSGFGLTLCANVSIWEIYQSLGTIVLLLTIISLIVIFLVSAVGSLIASRFVRPLETIAEKIDMVSKGDFDTKLGDYRAEELHQISMTFNDMTAHINELITQVYETKLLGQEAHIRYLQAQMNPHFLFNVLSMIEMKAAVNGDVEVQKKISMLSKLLQGRIFRKDENEISLAEEIEIAEFYLNLQNGRFGNKITYHVSYRGDETQIKNRRVPRLSIEPIVENAVAHGLEPKVGDGHIEVTIYESDRLYVEITDDGVGFDIETMEDGQENTQHSGVGLMNTDRMIKNLYGADYGLRVESKIGEGTKVLVCLPKK